MATIATDDIWMQSKRRPNELNKIKQIFYNQCAACWKRMKLSSGVHRIQPVNTVERNNHLKEQDQEIKIPKQNSASPILAQ